MSAVKNFTILFLFLFVQIGFACTGILIKTQNGATITGRTLEFGFDVKSNILVIPKGIEINFLSSAKDKVGYKMKSKYGFVGMNAVGKNVMVDGVNEAGLYYGAFYFAGFAVYDKWSPSNQSRAVSSEELGNYILGSFATVDEVKEGLKNITVVGSYIAEIFGEAPLHYAVTDRSGNSIVIEYSKEGLKIFDNTVHIITNNPSYDWHTTNLRNYVNLTPDNVNGISLNGENYTPLSQGSGMLGLPGDASSVSRFVRAAAFVNAALPSKDEEEGVFRAFHILNNFDIPIGLVKQKEQNTTLSEYTVWTSAVDTKNSIYYFKTYQNQSVKKVDLKEMLKVANGKIMVIEAETPNKYEALSTK